MLGFSNLVKKLGVKLVTDLRAQMKSALKRMRVPKEMAIMTGHGTRMASHHSVKNHPLERNHPLARVRILVIKDEVAAMKIETKAGIITETIENPINVTANQPMPKLANQNQSQIAVQAQKPMRALQVVRNAFVARHHAS